MDAMVSVGCVLILLAAFTLACAMNIQQFALTADLNTPIFKRVSCCSEKVSPRNILWGCGLAVYLVAQLLVVASLAFTPFALVSALFATVLVFDAIIASIVFSKHFNNLELSGMAVIIGSLALGAPHSPKVEYDITPEFIVEIFCKSSSISIVFVLLVLAASLVLAIRSFERTYASFPAADPSDDTVFVPEPVYRRMQIFYPTMLAVVETMGASSLKAIAGMVQHKDFSRSYIFWGVVCVWFCAIVSTVLWLRFVYQKFRTSECLSTEIGLATVFSIYVGLWVYQEQQYTNTKMVSILVLCTGTICVGIGLIVVGGSRANELEDQKQMNANQANLERGENVTPEHRNNGLGRNEAGEGDSNAETSPAALPMPIAAAPVRGVTEDREVQRNSSGRFPFMSPHAQRIRPVPKHVISQWAKEVLRRGSSLGRTISVSIMGVDGKNHGSCSARPKTANTAADFAGAIPSDLAVASPMTEKTFLEIIDNQHHHHHGHGQIGHPVNLHPVLVSVVGP
jgi:hypothetical protein